MSTNHDEGVTEATTLAQRLKTAREERGWTKADLRRRANMKSASTLSELERGVISESPQLGIIAQVLGVNAVWLQRGTGPKHPGDAPENPFGPIAYESAQIIDVLPLDRQLRARQYIQALRTVYEFETEFGQHPVIAPGK